MRISVRFLVSALILTATACGSSSTPTSYGGGGGGGGGCTSTSSQITIADFSFAPACTTVPRTTTVTWTNNGPSAHTTTSDATGWDSGQLAATNTYQHTFNSAGTFTYHCSNHPSMTASIVVTP